MNVKMIQQGLNTAPCAAESFTLCPGLSRMAKEPSNTRPLKHHLTEQRHSPGLLTGSTAIHATRIWQHQWLQADNNNGWSHLQEQWHNVQRVYIHTKMIFIQTSVLIALKQMHLLTILRLLKLYITWPNYTELTGSRLFTCSSLLSCRKYYE